MSIERTTFQAQIPIVPFVKQILLKEYGAEPIRITGQSLLGKQVMSFVLDLEDQGLEGIELPKVYGTTIQIELSTRLWKFLQRYNDLFQAGMFFERMAQRMMIQHIIAQVRAGRTAWSAMEDFLLFYDIGEDEYAAMSAYELWKLWKKSHPHLVLKTYADGQAPQWLYDKHLLTAATTY